MRMKGGSSVPRGEVLVGSSPSRRAAEAGRGQAGSSCFNRRLVSMSAPGRQVGRWRWKCRRSGPW